MISVNVYHTDFVTDEVIDRFCIIGTAAQCRQRIQELVNIGVNELNVYLMTEDKEQTLNIYGQTIIPAFAQAQKL